MARGSDCYQAQEMVRKINELWLCGDMAQLTDVRRMLEEHRRNCVECRGEVSSLWMGLFKRVLP